MSFSASTPAEPVQQANFNPSWIRSAFHGGISSSPRASVNEEEDNTLCHPIFVENRYGREDLLALMENLSEPPLGLSNCPFFVAEAAPPIVCTPLTEAEQRQQQNINSSKAMSQLSLAERNSIAAGAAYAGSTTPNSSRGGGGGGGSGGWTPVKSNRGNSQAPASAGRGGPRPFARGARVGDSPRESDETREGYFNARFSARGGRGGATLARGGSTTASATFNSRAQGLYDPRDPKDRPRNRLRSTSDETEATGPVEPGWTTVKPTWKEKENKSAWTKDNGPGWSRENSQTAWKTDNTRLPEWMGDGDKEESAISNHPGSFDEQGAYREQSKQHHDTSINNISCNERKTSPELNAWGKTDPRNESVPNNHVNERMMQHYISKAASGVPAHAGHGIHPTHVVPNPHSVLGPTVISGLPAHAVPGAVAYENPMPVSNVLIPQPPPKFSYLDPTETLHGPFPKPQMDAWFESGYFNDDLKVKRDCDMTFRALGELKKMNGNLTPFDFKDEPVIAQNVHAPGRLFNYAEYWNESNVNMINYPNGAGEMMQRYMGSQRQEQEYMATMAKRAEEYEKLREREEAVQRKEENIKKALEEERLRREAKQLELTKALEKQKKEEAEAARLREELRLMEEKLAREEEEKKKAEEEVRRRALQLKLEEDAAKIRKQQEMTKKMEEQRRKEVEENEQRKRAMADEQQRSMILEALRNAEAAEEQRRAALAKAQKTESPWKKIVASESHTSIPDDGWIVQQAPTKKVAPKAAAWSTPSAGSKAEKSLKEIQEEEERFMKLQIKAKAKKREEIANANIQTSGTWSNVTQKLNWNQPPKITSSKGAAAWGGASSDAPASSPSNWDGPTLQAANKTTAPAPVKKVATPKPVVAKPTPVVKSPASKNDESNFKSWVVIRLKQLNETVDAEVLADFLKSVENPNEVEDYVEGYLGSSKASKEFVKEFLQKRCEMRNRKTDKDDLSSASVAPATGTSAGKKKKKGTRLVVDGSCLGFRPAADPNRVNQGTIEFVTAAPSATARR